MTMLSELPRPRKGGVLLLYGVTSRTPKKVEWRRIKKYVCLSALECFEFVH